MILIAEFRRVGSPTKKIDKKGVFGAGMCEKNV